MVKVSIRFHHASPLVVATSSTITGRKKAGKFNIPGWNSVVKSTSNCQGSLLAMSSLNCNRGTWTKKDFKYSLGKSRKDVEIHKTNDPAAALQTDKTNQNVWQSRRHGGALVG